MWPHLKVKSPWGAILVETHTFVGLISKNLQASSHGEGLKRSPSGLAGEKKDDPCECAQSLLCNKILFFGEKILREPCVGTIVEPSL